MNSTAIRSLEIFINSSLLLNIAVFVGSSTAKSKLDANLIPLKILKASSFNRLLGSPTHLIILCSISDTPLKGSIIPTDSLKKIAF